MAEEGEWHKVTREKTMRVLDSDGVTYLHDHGKGGQKLRLFKKGTEGWHYSEIDIVILEDEKRVVDMIEIMDGPTTPKTVIGIVGTTALCEVCIDAKGKRYPFKSPRLLIILNSKELEKEGSVKQEQMAAIQNALSDELTSPVRLGKLRSIHIRTDAGLEEAVGSEGECTATEKRDSRSIFLRNDIAYA